MPTASKPRPRSTPTWTRRPLVEWNTAAGPTTKIDREKKVIYGVKVLGRFSKNSHGLREATNGTEYTTECMKEALPLYEGVEVLANHDTTNKQRGIEDVIGVLRNCRLLEDGIHGDLHYYESHPICSKLLEDAERGQNGVLGLSHDAEAGRERFDRGSRRLVIESLKAVKSVDLVRKPATNRNLWESHTVAKTFRELLEGLTLTPVRQKWRKRLVEDDTMGGVMAAPVEAEGGDVKAGLRTAACAIIDDESLDAAGKIAKLKILFTASEKLTQEEEPEEPVQEEEETDKDKTDKEKTDKEKTDKEKTEAIKAENESLKRRMKVRELVETAGIKADKVLLESLEAVPEATARKLIEREKVRGGDTKPRSGGPPPRTDHAGANSNSGGDFLTRIKD